MDELKAKRHLTAAVFLRDSLTALRSEKPRAKYNSKCLTMELNHSNQRQAITGICRHELEGDGKHMTSSTENILQVVSSPE